MKIYEFCVLMSTEKEGELETGARKETDKCMIFARSPVENEKFIKCTP